MFDTVMFAVGAWTVRTDLMTMKAILDGMSEVPPNDRKGTGQGAFDYDTGTRLLEWHITYGGLTGIATAGHIHGPARAGANAGMVIPFPFPASPIDGSATLTRAQGGWLRAGKLYVNVYTITHPDGEIRGQIVN